MKTKSRFKLFAGLAAVLAFAFVCVCFAPIATIANAYTLKTDISNSSFETTTDSQNNFSSNWSVSLASDDVVAKIVSTVDVETTSSAYFDFASNGLTNPGKVQEASDSNVLMLLFKASEGSDATAARSGIKTSTTTTLSSNSFYVLSVWAKTEGENVKFSFGTSGALSSNYAITASNADWAKYSLYIATSVENAAAVSIELWLGDKNDQTVTSSGAVFFDEVSLQKIDRAQYEKYKIVVNCSEQTEQNIAETPTEQGAFVVGDNANWTATKTDAENQTAEVLAYDFEIKAESEQGAGDADIFTSNVLKVTNNSEKAAANEDAKTIKIKSEEFTLSQFGIYRISFLAKSVSESASLSAKLELSNGANKSQSATLSASTVNSTFNDFTEYVFFVKVSYTASISGIVEITIPEQTTVLFDRFLVSNISNTSFSSGTYRIDLSSSVDKGIENGFFTNVAGLPKAGELFTALTWTTFGDKDDATMGIVPITTAAPNAYNYADFSALLNGATNPGLYSVNGQAVSLKTAYAISSNEEVYAGISNTLSTNTSTQKPYAQISVYVETQNATACVSLLSGTLEIAKIESIQTNGNWQLISFFVKPSSSLSLTLKISLGNESAKSAGTVFVSSATSIATPESVYNDHKAANNANEAFIDYTSFFVHTAIKENGVYEPIDFNVVLDNDATAVGGVLDLTNIDDETIFAQHQDALVSTTGEHSGEYLALANTTAGFSHIAHTSTISNTTTQNYVKISTKVKLVNLVGKAYIAFGDIATIELDQNTQADENGWIDCSVFVKVGTTAIGSFSTVLYLGSEDEGASGIVLLDEIATATSTAKEFKTAQKSNSPAIVALNLATTENGTANVKAKSLSNNPTAIFFIVLSSLVLVGVVIFAVIAYGVKRLPKRTRVDIQAHSNPKAKKTAKGDKNDKGFV